MALFETDYFPNEIAVSPANELIAIDSDDRLVVFDARGRFLRQIGEFGIDPGEFQYPQGVSVDGDGRIYVADNQRIQRFTGTSVDVWPVPDYPSGVAATPSGAVIVYALTDYQVIRLKPNGEVDYAWGPGGEADTEFDYPVAIAVDGDGHVFVLDEDTNLVYRFTDGGAGNIQQNWAVGSPGTDPGEFQGPEAIAVGNGRVFVAESGNSRVQALSAVDGSFLFQWQADDTYDLWSPEGIAVGADGRIYVTSLWSILVFELRES